jgi:hypothetical protein
MASRAIWFDREIAIGMAIVAIEFAMCLIQLQIGNGMLEIGLIPTAMTGIAGVIEFRDHLTGWMAGATR